jgi:hypothetical protein
LQRAQRVELALDFGDELGERECRLVAAEERVLGLRLGMAMQHRLPHRELVEIGVEQAGDDGLHRAFVRSRRRYQHRRLGERHSISSSTRPSATRAGHVASATSAGAAVASPVRTSKRPW